MIILQRPGRTHLEIEFILLNFEGTLATDRRIHPKAKDKLNLLSKRTNIYILTKGEQEAIQEILKKVKAEVVYFEEGEVSQGKLDLLRQLGATKTVAIGNGVDDVPMIEEAGLGICIIDVEGASGEAIKKADVIFTNILDALDFLLKPMRHKAVLGI
jgi:soluble P-type ATPase